ncbi:MAG: hypothetical protein P4L35_19395 [Ignavibacteriaceae bacterium]|nr:hypothetical protein [Ignavibacteriaceae bacterium]
MVLLDLKKCIREDIPIYYGRKEIEIIKIYEFFNLLDVRYKDDLIVFTVDLMALRELPSEEIGISIEI